MVFVLLILLELVLLWSGWRAPATGQPRPVRAVRPSRPASSQARPPAGLGDWCLLLGGLLSLGLVRLLPWVLAAPLR